MKRSRKSYHSMPDAPVGRRLTALRLKKKLAVIDADIIAAKPLGKKRSMVKVRKAVA